MATPEEEEKAAAAAKQSASYKERALRAEKQLKDNLQDRLNISMTLVETLKETLGITKGIGEFDKSLLSINRKISKSIITQREDLSDIEGLERQIEKNNNSIDQSKKLQASLTNSIGEDLSKEFKLATSTLDKRREIDEILQKELEKLNKGEKVDEARIGRLNEMAQSADEQIAHAVKNLSVSEQQLLVTDQNAKLLEQTNEEQRERLRLAKQIEAAEGLTGTLVGKLGKLMGFNEKTQNNIKKDAQDALKIKQEEGKLLDGYQGKLQGLSAYAKSFGTNFLKSVTDPAVIFAAIGDSLMRNSKLTNQFQTELGVSYGNALDMRQALASSADASGDLFINSEKLQKSFFALKETTGVFFDLSSQSAETFTNLTERIGLAGAAAGNLTMLMRLQGKETEKNLENLYDSTGAMLETSKTTASVKDILGDVATSSKGLQASLSANPGALAKAAIAARELGATLSDMEGTQKSLLDFESSIAAELEAELLTGKQLNLEKARTAALNNDLATVGEELGKQGVDLASFGKMNYLQQEAMAKAMGMTRDSMGEMVLRAEMQKKSLSEIRDTMGEQAYENAKALGAQDKINAATEKLKDIFGNILQFLTPVIDALASILGVIGFIGSILAKVNEWTGGFSNKLIGVAIVARSLGMSFGDMFSPKAYIKFFKGLMSKITTSGGLLKGLKSKMGGITDGLKDKSKGMVGGLKDKVKGMLGGDKSNIKFDERMAGGGRFKDVTSGKMVSNKAAAAAGAVKPGAVPKGVTDAAKSSTATPAPKDDGKALKTKMKNIAEGIKAFASTDVIKGAVAMIIAAPGLVALSLAAIPLKLVEKINGKAIQEAMKGIANGIKPFGDSKVIAGAFNMLIAAPGLVALSIAALPLKLIEKVNGKALQAGMKGIAKGLQSFANPMAVLGGLALIPISIGLIGLGAGAIGLAAVALLGAAAAVGMGALSGGLVALAAVAVPALIGIGILGLFGLALMPLGFALSLVAPLITAVGTAIATVIMSIADAVVTVMPALTQGLIDLATKIPLSGLLGLALALPGLALGVGILGGALLLSAPGFLIGSLTLPLIAPALAELNLAIAGIDGASFLAFSAGILVLGAGLLIAAPGFLIGSLTLPLISPALTQLSEAISGIDGGNFALFSLGMIGLAGGLTIMGVALPFVLAGIGAFTLFGAALSLAAPGIEAAGNAVVKIGNSIANIGNAISNILASAGAAILVIGKSISNTVASLTQSLIDLITKVPITNLLAIGVALPIFGIGLAAFGSGVLMAIPGLLAGALVLPLITSSLDGLSGTLAGIDGKNLLMVGAGIAGLAGGLTILGIAAPFALIGAGVLGLVSFALIPLGNALTAVSPALDIFAGSFERLADIDGGSLLGLAVGIGALGLVASGLAIMSPLIIIGSGALIILGLSMGNAAESMKNLAGVSSDSMIGFAKSITILGGAASLLGVIAPLVALGSGAIFLLGKAINPAAESMKKVADVGADSMMGFAAAIGILGMAASGMGLLAPLVALGAGTIFLLGQAIVPAAEAMQNLIGISGDSMMGFSVALNLLGMAASGMGLLAPLVALGAGAIFLLGQAIVPAAEAMKNLIGISGDSMMGFSVALNLLGMAATGMGVLAPLIALGAGAIFLLGKAITPAAESMKNLAGISADSISAFSAGLSQLSKTTVLIGAFAPIVALGAGAIFLLGKAITPAAESMKSLAGISAESILAFSTGLSMLGSTASMLGIVAPLVILGAGALYILGNALAPAAESFTILEGLNASTMLGFAGALSILGIAAALFGALSPAVILGAGALYVLGNAIVPAAVAFKMLEGLDPAIMTSFASSLFVLGASAAFFGGLFPLVLLGAGAIAILGLALSPLANLAPKLSLTNTALAGIAGSIGLLGTSLAGLDTSKLAELAEFGESINITANVSGGTVGGMSPDGVGSTPTGGTTVSVPGAGESSGEDMKAMIQETVTATIKALVPDMVAALKSGQGNIKVTNDNFNASSQNELPSQMRNVSNNNFA
jgi:hypothetical protein